MDVWCRCELCHILLSAYSLYTFNTCLERRRYVFSFVMNWLGVHSWSIGIPLATGSLQNMVISWGQMGTGDSTGKMNIWEQVMWCALTVRSQWISGRTQSFPQGSKLSAVLELVWLLREHVDHLAPLLIILDCLVFLDTIIVQNGIWQVVHLGYLKKSNDIFRYVRYL
jgi:hypothetical protein